MQMLYLSVTASMQVLVNQYVQTVPLVANSTQSTGKSTCFTYDRCYQQQPHVAITLQVCLQGQAI